MDTHSFYSISSGMYVVSSFLCLLTFSLMRILLLGYTPHLRLFGCWLCSFRPLMTVAPSSRQNDNRSQCVECSSFCHLLFRTHQCGRFCSISLILARRSLYSKIFVFSSRRSTSYLCESSIYISSLNLPDTLSS